MMYVSASRYFTTAAAVTIFVPLQLGITLETLSNSKEEGSHLSVSSLKSYSYL